MKLPLSWLKEYVDIEITPQELAQKLLESGFEIDELKYVGENISRVVVCRIDEITKHPDSDHLLVCKVDCGQYGKDIQIVTGAQNVFVGALCPVALDNSTLAKGDKIKAGKLRGVMSYGMFCGPDEIGIDENFYDDINPESVLFIKEKVEVGTDIKDVVGLNDWVFDVSITANRPDCQSILGMAREISAILKTKLKNPALFYVEKDLDTHNICVDVHDDDLCPRYVAHLVDNVKIEKSPVWLRRRLALCDVNSINNIVDITNYVLLELGQPMHAFDLEKLEGQEINVRRARPDEKIKTLDEKEFELNTNNLVICDAKKPVALAGIMGGFDSGINDKTSQILFESAKFMRENVRKTSRGLGQSSDSSRRYEKGVDEYTTGIAMKRALNLIDFLNCGNITSINFDIWKNADKLPKIIKTEFSKITNLLGISIPENVMVDILNRLNFKTTVNGDNLEVEVPSYRDDMEGYPDIAEEIIRIYGYNNIVPTLIPTSHLTYGGLTNFQKDKFKAKDALVVQGYNEIITYAFYGEKDINLLGLESDAPERNFIRIKNPLTEDISIMKTTNVPSMLQIINKNVKRGNDEGRLFELCNAYIPKSLPLTDFPKELPILSLGAFGEKESFYTIKGALEGFADSFGLKFKFVPTQKTFLHPYQSANIMLGNEILGFVGRITYEILDELSIKQPVFVAEINFEKLLENYNRNYTYKTVSKYLEIKRDLALIANDEITSAQIEEIMQMVSKKLVSIKLFDIYKGEQVGAGFKSMAYTLTFEPDENPLTHEEVDKYIQKILHLLKDRLNVVIR